MSELPARWDPRKVAVNRDKENGFLLRPGQLLVGPGDEKDAQAVLTGWKVQDRKTFGVTAFTRTPQNPEDPAREVLDAIARATKGHRQPPAGPGPRRAQPRPRGRGDHAHRRAAPAGRPGSSVRLAKPPSALPLRTTRRGDGKGIKIAVLDTGLFKHDWLGSVQKAAGGDDVWDVEPDQYADNESGHGTFIAGLILQVAPAAEVYVVKVLDSHGVGDDLTVAKAMEQLPQDIDIVNLSLGGYTDDDAAPLAIACALQGTRKQRNVVVAAAGNNAQARPFWPAAFKQVLAVGAVHQKGPQWLKADFSNHGWWVDAAARGVNLESTFAKGKTKAAAGDTPQPATDPTWTFEGWAAWDGTSFAAPITAGVLARTMSRNGFSAAEDAKDHLLATSPPAPQPDFPLAVLVDELS